LVNKNKLLYIQLNELASGDLYSILQSDKNFDIFNTFVQLILSIMFFHKCINAHHSDTHEGNFLYHKVKPGGYFHYNIYGEDYYLENKGYLWVIWDFGLAKSFSETTISINYDHKLIINSIDYYIYNYKLLSSNEYKKFELLFNLIEKYDNIQNSNLNKNLHNEILDFLIKNVSSFTTIKPSNIINNIPYIIEKKPEIKKPENKESYFKSYPPTKLSFLSLGLRLPFLFRYSTTFSQSHQFPATPSQPPSIGTTFSSKYLAGEGFTMSKILKTKNIGEF
jgi:hypothetical protein